MKKVSTIIFSLLIALSCLPIRTLAAEQEVLQSQQEYSRARVTTVEETILPNEQLGQSITASIESGPETGTEVQVDYFQQNKTEPQRFEVGDRVVLVKSYGYETPQYFLMDRYRVPQLVGIAVAFVALIILFAGKRGASAFVGLGVSVMVLGMYVVPQIAKGANPFLTSFVGAVIIALLSLYLAHGFTKRTSIALVATLAVIALSLGVSWLCVEIAQVSGLGSEDAYFIQSSPFGTINVKGLLLGGIIIGLLGVLDDVTTAQTATVDEIRKADPTVSFRTLYRSAMSVGREHITSLVNTLVLAYAGVSMPLLLLFSFHIQPFWVSLNSEFLAEEIIRTLVGSIVLVLAVPFTTFLAAYLYSQPWFHSHKGPSTER